MVTSHDLLGERRRQSPDRTALVCVATGRRLSYAALDDRARACALLMLELGLGRGDRCAILADNRVEVVEAFFAAGKSGVVLVPLNTRLSPRELAEILDDCGASLVLYGGAQAAAARALRDAGIGARFVALDEPAAGSGDGRYRDLTGMLDLAGGRDSAALDGRGADDDLYCLLYTSGTTGRPKGVMVPRRQVAFNGHNTARCWQLGQEDVSPVFVPLYHAGGLGALLAPLIAAGGTVVLHPRFDAHEVLRTIEQERCTVVLVVPTIARMLLESPAIDEVDLSSVRWLISGGAPLPVELIDAYRARGLVLRQGYGLTEAGPNCFAMSSSDAWQRKGTVGRPIGGTEARLVDADGCTVTDAGEAGELCLRGPHVALGYWNAAEATRSVLDGQGWLRTGDLACRDEEGCYTIVGRIKEMFISGGENVYPAEIESQLLQHPEVRDAAVVGATDERWGEVGVAFVVVRDRGAGAPNARELAEYLDRRLARYKIPRRFVFVDELPRTAYGKVVRSQLLEGIDVGS